MTLTVNFIGAGRVGRTLLSRAHGSGLVVQDVSSRSQPSARDAVAAAGCGRAVPLAEMRPADLWCLSVPDDQIATAAKDLAACGKPPACAFHCSGFHAADVMSPLRAAGWALASLHPVRSFADPAVAAAQFDGTHCGFEGDAAALPLVTEFAERIGGVPFPIRSDAKALYHAAAVFSNNFTTVLQAVAQEAWHEAGVPPEIAQDLQADLMRNAFENVTALGPQDALTGPAARGDRDVVAAQGKAVAGWNAEAGRLYRDLSEMATRLKTSGRI